MPYVVYWTDKPQFKTKKPGTHEIPKHKESQSAYALRILNIKHECGPIKDNMNLLKYADKTTLLIPYEKLYIQSYHHHKRLIPEQHISEHNHVNQLIYNLHNTSHPT